MWISWNFPDLSNLATAFKAKQVTSSILQAKIIFLPFTLSNIWSHLLIFVTKFNYKLQIFETMLSNMKSVGGKSRVCRALCEGRMRFCRSTCLKLIAFKLLDKSWVYKFIITLQSEAKARTKWEIEQVLQTNKYIYLRINHSNENLAHTVDIYCMLNTHWKQWDDGPECAHTAI